MDAVPSDNLYVKGLPAGLDETTVRTIFSAYGNVVQCKVLPTPPGVSDCAALVRMSNLSEAHWLVDNVAGNIPSGLSSPVVIRFATNTKGQGKAAAGGGGLPAPMAAPPQSGQPSNRLYMKGLPAGISEDQVKHIMSSYGSVLSVKVLPAPPNGATDSAVIVQMATADEAQWIVSNLDGNIPHGLSTPVQVRFKAEGPPQAATQQQQQLQPNFGVTLPGQGGGATSSSVQVEGLPAGLNEESISLIFSAYGTVNSCKIIPPAFGATDQSCMLTLSSPSEALWLVENLHGNIPHGLSSPVQVKLSAPPVVPAFTTTTGVTFGAGRLPQPGAPINNPFNVVVPGVTTTSGPAGGGKGGVPGEVSANLYMKGFPPGTTEETLRAIFSSYGHVLSCKVLPCPPGVPNVAALVRMGSESEAKWLVDNVNGNIPTGLAAPIEVRYSLNAKGGGKGAAESSPTPMFVNQAAGPPQPSTNLYMKGFDENCSEDKVKEILAAYGKVLSCKVLPPPPGKTALACLVRMSTLEEAQWLVDNLNGNIPYGQTYRVEVKFAANPTGGGARAAPY